jgi:hypothetical protein
LPRLEWFGEASTEASRRLDHAHIDHRPEPLLLKRTTARLAVLLCILAAALGITAGSAAAKSCGDQVIADWYGSKTGQLSKIYPLRCYREALKIIANEPDVSLYSSAPDDIRRAMAFAASIGPGGPRGPINSPDNLPSFRGGPDAKNGGKPPGNLVAIPKPTSPGVIPGLLHSSSASSVPLPAIVLGAVAALLLALGSAAYLARRRQLRRQTLRPRHANGRNP